ncbi:MAG: ATP-grasp domain-containing protein [Fimbriimonadaceae bacterium]|nr:ATP-grasp domain-containing protein [Fimbriimonadaceae bacterium]
MTFDLGILGGGQLARMSALAAHRMGARCLALDPAAECPASDVCSTIPGSLDDPVALAEVVRQCDVVTLENEFVPAGALQAAIRAAGRDETCVVPGCEPLATVQDKLLQRQALARHGVPQPAFCPVQSPEDLDSLAGILGEELVLKRRFGGYDGNGTAFLRRGENFDDAKSLVARWLPQGGVLAEALVPFQRELAVMVAVGSSGSATFPTVETLQTLRACDLVWTIPAYPQALQLARAAVGAVALTGLAGVELFETPSGEILVNEIAPRPHNTGHFTLDWGGPSQFEAHVRSVLGLSLPEFCGGEAAMANLLGIEGARDWRLGRRAALEGDPGVFFHWYGKREMRPGRKLGHINAAGPDARRRAEDARARFLAAWCR